MILTLIACNFEKKNEINIIKVQMPIYILYIIMNKIKGDDYEYFILKYLIDVEKYEKVWLC